MSSSDVRVYLLGRFEVTVRNRLIIDSSWPHAKARALLKLLALQTDRALHREQALDELWRHLQPSAAASNLRKNLHFLRSALAEDGVTDAVLSVADDMLVLSPDVWLDIDAFRDQIQVARRSQSDPALFEQALETYSGDLLPEDLYEGWSGAAREELQSLRNEALAQVARLYEVTGNVKLAEERLRQLLEADPVHEEGHRSLMRLYAQAGNREQAIRQFERCRDLLRSELGLEPSEETEALRYQITEGVLTRPERVSAAPTGGVFVGRQREMEDLRKGLEDAAAGRSRLMLLVGEPGIGKTRTAEELATCAGLVKARVLWGRSDEEKGTPAYWPWVKMIRSYARSRDPEALLEEMGAGAPDIAQIVPEVRDRLPDLPAPLALDGEGARFRLFDSICTFLTNAGEHQPLALIFDDLHWADTPSLLLLRFLAREMRDARILIVGTYRKEEVGREHPLTKMLGELNREPHCQSIHLGALGEEDVARFIEVAIGSKPPDALVGAVYERAEGNPFFTSEVVRLLRGDGRLENPADVVSWSVTTPPGVREVISSRLERLSDACRRILTIASVIGREFGLTTLKATSDMSGGGLLEVLDEAAGAALITEAPSATSRYTFSHALIRETLYEDLSLSRRVLLHRTIGEVLEQSYGAEVESHLTELAYHFYEAAPGGDADKAVAYATRAGDQAVQLLAYEEAAKHYERALKALDLTATRDQHHHCELLLALGEAQTNSSVSDDAVDVLARAVKQAEALSDPQLQGTAAIAYSCAVSRGPLSGTGASVPTLERALEALGMKECALKGYLLAELSLAMAEGPHGGGHRERRASLAREAMTIAEGRRDLVAQADALDALHLALYSPRTTEERLAVATEQIQVAKQAGDPRQILWGRLNRTSDLVEVGEMEEVDRELPAIYNLIDQIREHALKQLRPTFSGMRALMNGRYEEAEDFAVQLQPIANRTQHPLAQAAIGVHFYDIRRAQGRLGELEAIGVGLAEENVDTPLWKAMLAHLYLETNQTDRAREWFDRISANSFTDIPDDWTCLGTLLFSADVARRLRDRQRAADLYEMMRPYADRNVVLGPGVFCLGSASRPLGQLAATMGRWKDAERHFEDALTFDRGLDARPWLARTQYEYADMLNERGRSGDSGRANALVSQAVATFEELGMKADLQRAARSEDQLRDGDHKHVGRD